MRLIVIEQACDLQALSAKILKKSGAREISPSTLEQLKILNPHVDFQRIDTGTVLLLPAAPELNDTVSQSLSGNALEDFIADIHNGFEAVAKRMRASAASQAADQAAVNAVVNSAAVKRLIANDKLLQKQLDDVNRQFTSDERAEKEAMAEVDAMRKAVETELAALGGLWR